MYFDIDYWWRVVRHVHGLHHWRGRNRMLLKLLVWVPLSSLFHAVCMLLDYLFFPRLWYQEVKQPVFIVGHARSGTTLMHRLLSADGDRFSYFLYWEMFFPSLLQKKAIRWLGRVDDQYLGGVFHKRLLAWDEKTFGPYRHMHNMSLWNAEEDCFAMASAFVTQQWSLEVPMMDVIDVFHVDTMGPRRHRWMRHYRALIKRQLFLNGETKTHLAKNPVMSGWVEALLAEFPDARFVVMLRHPEECIPSCLKLVELTWQGKGWQRADYQKSLGILTEISFEHFHNPRSVLSVHSEVPQLEVDYRELTRDPRQSVQIVYDALGMELSEGFDAWLREQAESEKAHHSRFEYSLGEYEVTGERIRGELSEFYRRYQWPELTKENIG